jgi:hypothetical protein
MARAQGRVAAAGHGGAPGLGAVSAAGPAASDLGDVGTRAEDAETADESEVFAVGGEDIGQLV